MLSSAKTTAASFVLLKFTTMKAAVIYNRGEVPQYVDFPEPATQNDNELLMTVKAAAIKNLDRSIASGKHYSSEKDASKARIIGGDGVGVLEDGTRVYAVGVSGMIAEKAIVEKDRIVPLPQGIDDNSAAALANAVAGSAMGLRFRAGIKRGETVLINGATGVTGTIAVQIAKHYGAGKVIATGRNEQALQSLTAFGADEIISINQSDEAFVSKIKSIHSSTPIDIVIDYLWGHTAELILASLKGKGSFTHKTRFVSIGAVTGDIIQLSAENLRSVDLQLSGSGLGSWTKDEVKLLFSEILSEMFQLVVDKKMQIDTVTIPLKDIEQLWNMQVSSGERLVVVI